MKTSGFYKKIRRALETCVNEIEDIYDEESAAPGPTEIDILVANFKIKLERMYKVMREEGVK